MTVNMLVFEYKETEKKFFESNQFDGFNITFFEECLNEDFLKNISEDLKDNAFVISVFINSVVNENIINSFKNLRIISTRSTGYDHIDLKTSQSKNITVLNVENYGETSVAQYTFGLIISLVRNIFPASNFIKGLQQDDRDFTGRDLSQMTMGVIGTGAIGAAVCKYAKAFNMNVLAYDLHEKKELEETIGLNYVSFEALLQNSDIVTLHIPYTGDNYHMFSLKEFQMMKEGAFFINTSRGEMVDLTSLYNFIESKKLGGAALDVLTCESMSFGCKNFSEEHGNVPLDCRNETVYVKKLSVFNNVIITPHIAYDTEDAVDYILEKTMSLIKCVIKGDKTTRIV